MECRVKYISIETRRFGVMCRNSGRGVGVVVVEHSDTFDFASLLLRVDGRRERVIDTDRGEKTEGDYVVEVDVCSGVGSVMSHIVKPSVGGGT